MQEKYQKLIDNGLQLLWSSKTRGAQSAVCKTILSGLQNGLQSGLRKLSFFGGNFAKKQTTGEDL